MNIDTLFWWTGCFVWVGWILLFAFYLIIYYNSNRRIDRRRINRISYQESELIEVN